MLKIGDFSKLANVTVKALRLYAEMGLLKPAWIDRYSGYRYYSLDQLPRLNRILALKELGLSLEQVQRVLNSRLSAEELRGMLHLKQAEIQQQLAEEQMRLARVAARLKQIEQEDQYETDAVVVRPVEAMLMAYTSIIAPTVEAMASRRAQARREIEAWLAASGAVPSGPWLVIYTASEYVESSIPAEVGVVLGELPRAPLPANGRVMVRKLPALPLAAVYARPGPQDGLANAYNALYSWVETNGYRVCGQAREVYWQDAGEVEERLWANDDSDLRAPPPAATKHREAVELQIPIEAILYPDSRKELVMEPKIIEYHEFLVVGTVYQGSNKNQEVAAMWDKEFLPRIHEIKRTDNYVSYGVCEMDASLPEGEFRYIAGVEVARPEDAPADMRLIRIPAGKYAIFKHTGSLQALPKTYEYIYQVWLPQSGYKRADLPDLEVYTHEFHGFQPDSVLELWVPIE